MTTIDTPLGAVRGQAEDGYLAFRGLRYAQAPLGEMRYR
ncbi:MAG: carboxylesterase family protein, partial [Gammaproteobacteria bacterium]|nr:carboxylesterase family protein [Gammaproteobacteria bacterium]